jgi:2-polyprenyl-6-methoxyphenol hydroxylase-like FAD-dependent oxidoreductase
VANIVIVGGGVVGLGLGMMLAKDGHGVRMLERDAEPPPADAAGAWESWERRGVNQFRLAHFFMPRYRQIIETELPEVVAALERDGALRLNPLLEAPPDFTGGRREGDDRFEMLTGRRAVVERAVAEVAEATPGLELRRGVVAAGLQTGAEALPGVPHITGVTTTDGDNLTADLVVDCMGRRSALPAWLTAAGARPPDEELEDSGFMYYGRHFRSPDGSLPADIGGALQEFGSISVGTLAADNGTWSVVLIAGADDRALLGLKEADRWEKAVRSLPTVAHWIDAEPLEERVITMAKIEDRIRNPYPDGRPVATGVVAVADAWACTNPSLGRGASIGMMHAQLLRDCLRSAGSERPAALQEAFAEATARVVEPWYRATLAFDRHRLAEMKAVAAGQTYEPEDPTFGIAKAMRASILSDPDCFRNFMDVAGVLATPEEVLARPGSLDKFIEHGGDWRERPEFGPTREELVALAAA